MRVTIEVGNKERSQIVLCRNWFTGALRIMVNGQVVARESASSFSTHFSFKLSRHYEFSVGTTERHKVVIEKKRPLLLAGVRPHTYRVFVDDQLIHEQQGY